MTKYRLQAVLFVLLSFMLGCNEYMIVGVLPDIASEYHTSLSSLGYLVTMFGLIYAFVTPVLTTIIGRWKRHHVLFVLLIIFLISNTWTALSTNYLSLALSRVLTSSISGTIISIDLVFANFVAPLNKRASLVSWVFAGFSIASVIGVPIGTFISQQFNWHVSFWVISVMIILITLMMIWLAPRDSPQVSGNVKLSQQFSVFRDQRITACVFFVVSIFAAQYTFYTYIRVIVTNLMGFNNTWLNWLLFAMGLFFIVGNQLGGYIADNGGVHRLSWVYVVMTILLLCLAPTYRFKWLSITIVAILCITFTTYAASTQLLFMDIAEQKYPQSLDLASSLNSISANIGIALGSMTAAETVHFTSLSNCGNVAAIYGVLAVLLVLFVSRKYKQAQ